MSKAANIVHAAGGDVVRMGHDAMTCVFPLSGDPSTGNRRKSVGGTDLAEPGHAALVSESAGAVLRAAKCAFTMVNQLTSSTPELVSTDPDVVSRAAQWPGLRRHSLGARVLVVDPLQLTRMAHGRLLDHFGCMTHFAENASQAAAACANMEFDVILMGVLLPDIDGYQLARHIRKHGGPVNSRAYIAAVTMLEQPELLEQCLKSGMNETIRKPADMASLRGMFRRMRASQRERKKRWR